MQKAYMVVYGKPYLANSLKYDAENEMFYGDVKSTKGGFSEQVAIKVPLSEAENFEKDLDALKTEVIFNYDGHRLTLNKIVIKKAEKSFVAVLSSVNFNSEDISVSINEGSLNLPTTPLISSSLSMNSTKHSIGEVRYSTDPEVAKLQKQKFELERKSREKNQSIKREVKLKKQREALEVQIALLQQNSGGIDDISKFLEKSKIHKIDKTKWLFIVAIENYEYTDPVAYSANSAKQFKRVMKKRLGILEKNIRTLINRGATSGKIRHNLKDIVAHVKKGDTIYFYYSGHGIPVPTQKNAPYLLAQDMSPQYVADDERFKLQNIYKSLSNSKASKVVAFIDSCFSGGTDNQTLIKGVAATRIKPKKVTFDKTKMIVISAGSGTQYSNKYDDKSNRLFSYYLMRGLIKNNSNTSRLYDYVKSNVQEKSYEMGESYEQVPVYDGNIGLEL
ncbi:MAG: caspase family protein [Sulfurimonas sp.]|nr:caspase family protein [Sulfurimonas sp.]